MSKPRIVYARMKLESFDKHLTLSEFKYEINRRLYEVLNDEFYTTQLTENLAKLHPAVFDAWSEYWNDALSERPKPIQLVGKFEVFNQKVQLLDVRFY